MTHSRFTKPDFSLALMLGAALATACGDAPEVSTGHAPLVRHEAAATEAAMLRVLERPTAAQTEVSADPIMIDPASEQALAADSADGPGESLGEDVCAPSLFPRTQNVPSVIERIVTETVELPVEVSVTPTVLLLLDRSSSMRAMIQGEPVTRWEAMQALLVGGEQPLLEGLQDDVSLGMTHYSAVDDSDPGNGPGHCVKLSQAVEDIRFETGAFEALRTQQEATELGQGTPTGEALAAASASFQHIETKGEKHIVVVTDGEPAHCNDLSDHSSEAAIEAVLGAASAARQLGITVHVIGIGPDVREEHLRQMAEAGGGLYRSALTSESMQTAFEDVLREVDVMMVQETVERIVEDTVMLEQRSCSFELEFGEHGPDAFLEAGAVRLDGQALVLDAANGWTINAADELELLGDACQSYLQAEADPELEIELACPNKFVAVPH